MADEPIDNDLLISLVELRPVLWDRTDELYKNRDATRAAWKEILKKLYPNFKTKDENKRQMYEIAQVSSQKSKTDPRRRKKRQSHGYDFIIVGAGSAGCVVANRLSEIKSWRILLIEAGPEEPDVTSVPALPPALRWSSIDWNYQTQPEKLTCRGYVGGRCHWARGKTMGGSSATNYLIYIRGNRLDYDNWAALGNPGWSYKEVLPYFRKSENNRNIEGKDTYYHGVGGPLYVERFPYTDANAIMLVEAFNETGLPIVDLNAENNIGTELGQSTSFNGRRWSTNMAYIRPIRDVRPNIDIMVNAYVTKVIIDPKTKVAQGVTYVRNGVYRDVYARKEVIVSAGSINSPKLLMLSGIGPKRHLRNLNIPVLSDLQVGQNLQDHATSDGLIIALSNKTSTQVSGPELLNQITKYYEQPLDQKSGPLSSTSTLNGIGYIKTKYARENAPDIQMLFDGQHFEDLYADPQTYAQLPVFPLAFFNSFAARPFLLTPRSRGQILLNRTDPVFGQPLIYPGFFTVKEDVDVLVEGMRYVVTLEQTEAFKKNGAYFVRRPIRGCEKYDWGTYKYFFCLLVQYTSTIYHPVGTCKMGPSEDKTAVIDARLRVYDIKGLRVIDGSIMPQIVRGNTNAPIIMIGEKASDMIKEDYKVSNNNNN
ncbi:glucose dehydrogenase [FAD, quinone]-like [Maniola jurtina]|uniref:glucose dehydrogenase [FAD, quinone]-like n=1 Tax=Maniola jurtina TaxID=191418 RepID=UPI001E687F9E|nr:glucose dehydrogenase [FAD, quinone]-like [Maniola jurtina]